MKHYCRNHKDKIALSFCHSCGEYFCGECLSEGDEYYYCKQEKCDQIYCAELSKNGNISVKLKPLSKESKFIKRVAIVFIALSSITILIEAPSLIMSIWNDFLFEVPSDIKFDGNVVINFLFNYSPIFVVVKWLMYSYSLFASIKLYGLHNRKGFIWAIYLSIIQIIIFNIILYSYLEMLNNIDNDYSRQIQYLNYWRPDKNYIVLVSELIIIIFVYLIIKFSSNKIKKEFVEKSL